MTTTNDPDEIRREIERTRAELSDDVDALAEKVNPRRAAERQADKVRGAVTNAKERVFGAAEDAKEAASERWGAASDTAQGAPAQLRGKTAGNPIAAGLVAFGLGLLVASAIPASRTERDLVERGKQSDAVQGAAQGVKEAAQDVADHLREPAREAVEQVKATATEGAQEVKEKATEGAAEVKGAAAAETESVKQEAKDTKESVQRSGGPGPAATPRPAASPAPGTTPGAGTSGALGGSGATSTPARPSSGYERPLT
jgi:hypothetical protein